MQIVDLQEKIKTVATRWCDQYSNYASGSATTKDKKEKEQTLLKLYRLNKDTATKKDVEEIIGPPKKIKDPEFAKFVEQYCRGDSWLNFKCDECGNQIDKGVKFRDWDEEDPNYMKPIICKECLEEALESFQDD